MSREERQRIANSVRDLRDLMYEIVDEALLVPAPLRGTFRSALTDLDDRGAFEEVINALHSEEETGRDVATIEGALDSVGLLGRQLELKLAVIDWANARARASWEQARQTGLPGTLEPDGDAEEGGSLWQRARKLLAKLLETIDNFFASLIKALAGNIGEIILENKKALESVLDR
ncbi:hypothetical protein [Streptomyces antibioticus]|uniref:hypothetical protein n=1 Tax=Streptomyces antibioticus TaxID=1890 RepID=UPI0033FF02F2